MIIALYITAIIIANIITATLAPIQLSFLTIPAGTVLIGLTFLLRDAVQYKYGRTGAYKTILTGLICSILFSVFNGDILWISLASAASFLVSETVDTEVYTRLRSSLFKKVLLSGLLGGSVDSILFAVIGLSPLTTGILPWNLVLTAIIGQVIVKCLIQITVACSLRYKLALHQV